MYDYKSPLAGTYFKLICKQTTLVLLRVLPYKQFDMEIKSNVKFTGMATKITWLFYNRSGLCVWPSINFTSFNSWYDDKAFHCYANVGNENWKQYQINIQFFWTLLFPVAKIFIFEGVDEHTEVSYFIELLFIFYV